MEPNITTNMQPISSSKRWLGILDMVGLTISTTCAIHCLLLPMALTLLPLVGLSFLAHDTFDVFMLVTTVSLASASLCWGARVHGRRSILIFIALAVLFFGLGMSALNHSDSHLYLAIGGLSLALGHLLNRRFCRSCRQCCNCK